MSGIVDVNELRHYFHCFFLSFDIYIYRPSASSIWKEVDTNFCWLNFISDTFGNGIADKVVKF